MIPSWFTRDIIAGDAGRDVDLVQRKLGATATGVLDEPTQARVRGLQRKAGLAVTGYVDAETAVALGERATVGRLPIWHTRPLSFGCEGGDVTALRRLLGLSDETHHFDHQTEAAVRRFQSGHGIRPSGLVDESTAILLGEED